jgi:hypothetical protein
MTTHLLASVSIFLGLATSSVSHATQADRLAPTTLRFAADGSAVTEGVALQGQNLTLNYDPIRLSQCRGKNKQGFEDWTVQVFLSIDGSDPLVFDLIEGRGTLFPYAVPAHVVLPEGQRLEVWFKASDGQGCVQWDSNQGKNYVYAIYALADIPNLTFTDRWNALQNGILRAGQPLRLHYDLNRATTCRTGGYHGSASWDVTPKLFVDGKPVPAQTITFPLDWSRRGQQDVLVMLPEGQEITLWFENSGYDYYAASSCLAYDSNYGKNFRFPLN